MLFVAKTSLKETGIKVYMTAEQPPLWKMLVACIAMLIYLLLSEPLTSMQIRMSDVIPKLHITARAVLSDRQAASIFRRPAVKPRVLLSAQVP